MFALRKMVQVKKRKRVGKGCCESSSELPFQVEEED